MNWTTRGVLGCALLSALAGCANETASADDPALIAAAQQSVEGEWRAEHYDYVRSGSRAADATGYVVVPFPGVGEDGLPLRGTCGATFISPRYAITAAHCVAQTYFSNPASDDITIVQPNVRGVSNDDLAATRRLRGGAFPDWRTAIVDAEDGYTEARYDECRIVHRCGSSWGPYNCTNGQDIALLRCADRSIFGQYLPVADYDPPVGSPVDMFWFHEVIDGMPVSEPPPLGTTSNFWYELVLALQHDRYQHYTLANSVVSNFHYYGGNRTQTMPLVSLPWPSGQRRTITSYGGGKGWTDMFGCHGTSGSGVLWNDGGELKLLGPVTTPGAGFGNRLCANMESEFVNPGSTIMGYVRSGHTLQLANTAFEDDREWFTWWPPPGGWGGWGGFGP